MEGEVWRLELSSMIAVPQGGVPEAERHHRFIIRINTVPGKDWIVKGDTLCRKVVCTVHAFYNLHIYLKRRSKSTSKNTSECYI